MSQQWPLVSLGELIRLERRPVELLPDRQYREIGIYCFGRGVFHKTPRTGLEVGDKKLYQLREGDLILQVTFAWEGAIALCGEAEDGLYGSTRYPTFRVNDDRCFAPFIARYLCTSSGLEQINKICPGSAGRNRVLSIRRISEIKVPLPPLAEQRRIVARIEKLAAQINEARTLRQQTATEAETFVISVHSKLSGSRVRSLGQILQLHEEQVPIATSGSYLQVGIRSFGGGLFKKPAVNGVETTYKTFNRLYDGAVVLSQVKGWEGAIAVCDSTFAGWFASPEYRTFRCIAAEARPRYIGALVRTEWFWSKLSQATRGVGARRERTRPEQFLAIEMPMPDLEKQKDAEELFMEVETLKLLQGETAAKFDLLLPAVLDRAFRGEL